MRKKDKSAISNWQLTNYHAPIAYCLLLIVCCLLVNCKRDGFHKTSSGLEYKIYTSNTGQKAKVGDYLTMYLVYKSADDSVIYDSHKEGAPWHFQLKEPSFHGSYEEGLTLLAANDSATFLVSADSMYTVVFKKSLPKSIAKGSKLKFDIKLERIETEEEARLADQKLGEEKRKVEQGMIDQYLKANNLDIAPTPDGLYFLKKLSSTGLSPDRRSICLVEYTGRFLNGKVFESSEMDGHPKQVTLGQEATLRGWEKALLLMRTGEKATIILPSNLAFGREGRRNAVTGIYDIKPYTPVVYDISLRAVK